MRSYGGVLWNAIGGEGARQDGSRIVLYELYVSGRLIR
jgi:hypothetical protein